MIGKKDREAIAKELKAIRSAQGKLTADEVVNAARNKKSALHRFFDWDDKTAAHAARLQTARKLISCVRVRVEMTERVITCVGYIRDPDAAPGQGYIETGRIKTGEERAFDALNAEAKRAVGSLRRLKELATLWGMEAEVDAILEDLDGLMVRLLKAA